MTPEERQRHIRELAERVAERLAEHWPADGAHINELEGFAERIGRDLQQEISGRLLREEAGRKDGNRSACKCGAQATYQRHHGLMIVTAAGRERVLRPYYHCDKCGEGHCPADVRLGLGPANTTPTAQARLAVLAVLEPYVQVRDLVAQLGLPLELDIKSTERVTQAVGARVAAASRRPYGKAERPVAIGFDGVMIPTRHGYKEARCGVVYEPEWEAGRTREREAALRKEYFATTGSRESLVAVVCARARARAAGTAIGVVCDGQALDWVDLDPYLPLRVEILDFYHAMERVAEVSRAMHPGDVEAGAAWRTAMEKELLEIGPWELLRQVEAWEPKGETALEVRRIQLAYFERQQERMHYPEYLRRGFPIGSGAVEGACKHVVGDRFDGGGMRWKLETAEPVMQLRAALLTEPRLDLRRYAGTKQPAVPA